MGQPYDITITLNYDIGVNYCRTVTRIGTENENNITGCTLQVILFEIDCAIFYTNLHEFFCQFIS